MFFGCQLAIFITYVPLNFLWELMFPPKETKAMDINSSPEEVEAAEKAKAKAEAIEEMGKPAIDLENAENADQKSNTSENKEEPGEDENNHE